MTLLNFEIHSLCRFLTARLLLDWDFDWDWCWYRNGHLNMVKDGHFDRNLDWDWNGNRHTNRHGNIDAIPLFIFN